jgi:hypothetical protein
MPVAFSQESPANKKQPGELEKIYRDFWAELEKSNWNEAIKYYPKAVQEEIKNGPYRTAENALEEFRNNTPSITSIIDEHILTRSGEFIYIGNDPVLTGKKCKVTVTFIKDGVDNEWKIAGVDIVDNTN